MALGWNAVGALGLFNALLAASLAIVIFRSRPHHLQNRRLALVLTLEGAWFIGGGGILYFTDDAGAAYASQGLTEILYPAMVVGYLLFIATMDTPWTRPLRRRPAELVLWGLLLALPLVVVARLDLFVTGIEPVSYAPWEAINGPWRFIFRRVGLGLLVLVFLVVVDTWRRAPRGTANRQRAGVYAIAFGARLVGPLNGNILTVLGAEIAQPWSQILFQTTILVYYLALAYGILRHQLFDIDLKLKFAIEKSTVVAVFAGAVFVFSEVVEDVLGVDQLVPAILVAAIIALTMRPLVRFGERVADAVLPGVSDTDEYRKVRRNELYAAAVGSAMSDGRVTQRERQVLETLADRLGLTGAQARAIETDARRTLAR